MNLVNSKVMVVRWYWQIVWKAGVWCKGRKPTAREKQPEIQRMRAEGMKPDAIAAELGISESDLLQFIGLTS